MGCRCSKKIGKHEDVIQVAKYTQGCASPHEDSPHSATVNLLVPADLSFENAARFRCLKVFLQDDWDDISGLRLAPIYNDDLKELMTQANQAFEFIPKVINKFQATRSVFTQSFHGMCIEDFDITYAFKILLISLYASLQTAKFNILIINSAPYIKISSISVLHKETFALYKVWTSYIEYIDSIRSDKSIENIRLDRYNIQLETLKQNLKQLSKDNPRNDHIIENLEYIKRARGLISDFQGDLKSTFQATGAFYTLFHSKHNSFKELGALCAYLNSNSAERIVHLLLPHFKS
jgi:hypothetical protein